MLRVFFKDLQAPATQVLPELVTAYTALRVASIRENNLHSFLRAEVALKSLENAENALERPVGHIYPAHYFIGEPTDSVEDLMEQRMAYVYNAPFA